MLNTTENKYCDKTMVFKVYIFANNILKYFLKEISIHKYVSLSEQ